MRRWCLPFLIFLTVVFFAGTAEALKWVNIGKGEGVSLHAESDSVTDGPEGSKEAWFMFEYNPPDCTSAYAKTRNKCVSSYTFLERHYSNKTFCIFGLVHYFADGTNTGFSSVSCEIKTISPGTAGELKWKYLFDKR